MSTNIDYSSSSPGGLPFEFIGARPIVGMDKEFAYSSVELGFVVHVWESKASDHRIAVVYPLFDSHILIEGRYEDFADWLKTFLSECSHVAVITDETYPKHRPELPEKTVLLCSPARRGDPFSGAEKVRRIGTQELSSVLGFELPYWPNYLRDREAMLSWRPGHSPQSIEPTTSFYRRDTLLRLAEYTYPIPPSNERHLIPQFFCQNINRHIEHRFQSEMMAGVAEAEQLHGCCIAAYPRVDIATSMEPIGPFQVREMLLNVTIPDEEYLTSLANVLFGDSNHRSWPFMNKALSRIFYAKCGVNSLADEWMDRLEPTNPETGSTLPGHLLRTAIHSRNENSADQPDTCVSSESIEWKKDPLLDYTWVAVCGDTAYGAVGDNLSGAYGHLVEVEMTSSDTIFMRTSSGRAYPFPAHNDNHYGLEHTVYNSGYQGTGPTNLGEAITTLAVSADLSLSKDSILKRNPGLMDFLEHPSRTPPLRLSAAKLSELLADINDLKLATF